MSTQTASPDTSTSLDIEELVAPFEDNDDPNHHAHFIRPTENKHIIDDPNASASEISNLARMLGAEVVALCGHRWVPKSNPTKYPVCPKCVEIGVEIRMGNRR